jgi:hypothetical protein
MGRKGLRGSNKKCQTLALSWEVPNRSGRRTRFFCNTLLDYLGPCGRQNLATVSGSAMAFRVNLAALPAPPITCPNVFIFCVFFTSHRGSQTPISNLSFSAFPFDRKTGPGPVFRDYRSLFGLFRARHDVQKNY